MRFISRIEFICIHNVAVSLIREPMQSLGAEIKWNQNIPLFWRAAFHNTLLKETRTAGPRISLQRMKYLNHSSKIEISLKLELQPFYSQFSKFLIFLFSYLIMCCVRQVAFFFILFIKRETNFKIGTLLPQCNPNLQVVKVLNNHADVEVPRLALFACRDILENEELTFDYRIMNSARASVVGRIGFRCCCGESNCCDII